MSETEGPIDRLDRILARIEEQHSGFKDMVLSAGGSMAALTHAAAGDEIIKDTFANYAFEHYEIAAYKSLLQLSDQIADGDISSLLQQTLDEEERMAQWINDNIGMVTAQYVALRESEQTAKR
ncbi:DUF892 family protein [Pelagibacterium sp. H642]|uniref:DUF892 family protein n=1 Tax=Pelagibacterium sp. H642 TaxID=1881069 RepID=UPI0028160165|nr:DUF892 family protein [Pelagibacterium sp. H642]WMT92952.1 ferritin-like domain-containing protein [Pelagibacterium sp. H642]